MQYLESWGRTIKEKHRIICLKKSNNIYKQFKNYLPGLPYGYGKSYGDSCLNTGGNIWKTNELNDCINFDIRSGVLECQSGVSIYEIHKITIPSGWMMPVSPGTQFVSIGGAIANDIHGKNQHLSGTFSEHLIELTLLRSDGSKIICSRNLNRNWFRATCGGIGLTGIIISCKIQLRKIKSTKMNTEKKIFNNLREFFHLADSSEKNWEYSVAWLDSMFKGERGIFMKANHSKESEIMTIKKNSKIKINYDSNFSLINNLSIKIFNSLYFNLHRIKNNKHLNYYSEFFYPLDSLKSWNKLYGKSGFYQFQCVIPKKNRYDSISEMTKQIRRLGEGSFLSVIKTFGKKKPIGMLSFPIEGVTITLDFPNKGTKTIKMLRILEEITSESGGRIYLAKDSTMKKETFQKGYPKFKDFIPHIDSGFKSNMYHRLFGN